MAQNLKYLREQKGIKQRELSGALGLSSGAVGNWENKSRTPDIETIIKLAQFFDVTLDDLLLKALRPPAPVYVNNLHYLRTKHGMTQKDMADLLRRQESSYCLMEEGTFRVSVEDLEKLADFFGVTMDQLIKQDLSRDDRDGKTK